MAEFSTKFNLTDTVYYIDEDNIKLLSGTVSSILVRQDLTRGTSSTPKVKYVLRENPLPIDEEILLNSIEAKAQMDILLTNKQSEINSL